MPGTSDVPERICTCLMLSAHCPGTRSGGCHPFQARQLRTKSGSIQATRLSTFSDHGRSLFKRVAPCSHHQVHLARARLPGVAPGAWSAMGAQHMCALAPTKHPIARDTVEVVSTSCLLSLSLFLGPFLSYAAGQGTADGSLARFRHRRHQVSLVGRLLCCCQ